VGVPPVSVAQAVDRAGRGRAHGAPPRGAAAVRVWRVQRAAPVNARARRVARGDDARGGRVGRRGRVWCRVVRGGG